MHLCINTVSVCLRVLFMRRSHVWVCACARARVRACVQFGGPFGPRAHEEWRQLFICFKMYLDLLENQGTNWHLTNGLFHSSLENFNQIFQIWLFPDLGECHAKREKKKTNNLF